MQEIEACLAECKRFGENGLHECVCPVPSGGVSKTVSYASVFGSDHPRSADLSRPMGM